MSFDFSGRNKLHYCRRLNHSWRDLATILEIPPYEQAQFAQGGEGLGIWDWLEARQQLVMLPLALEEIDRADLARIFTSEQKSDDYNRLYLNLQSKLPKIDFKSLEPTLNKLLAHSEQGCAALLLLQNSYTMGGEWCTARIRVLLQDQTSDFKHWPVSFDPRERTDKLAVLQGLASYMNLAPQQDQSLEAFAQAVIETMMGSLQSGSIVFIELKKWEYLEPGPQVLDWFMEFWQAIVDALAEASQHLRQIKIFALIVADPRLPQQHIKAEYQCSARQFEKTKILELRLKKWTLRDIQDWMGAYSGLTAPQIDRIARKIHGATQGLPSAVARALLEECCPDAAH